MLEDNIANSYISIIALISFLIFLIISKIGKKEKFSFLLDKDFDKPQAFHNNLIPRSGGVASIISLIILFTSFKSIYEFPVYEYIYFSFLLFVLGFLDDIKVNFNPSIRLICMIVIVYLGLSYFDIKITKTGLGFMNSLLENNFLNYVFLILCFLFIINGSNLIDGFNGLLIIHLIIINFILIFILFSLNNYEFSIFLSGQILIMFCFLLFNFPSSKMFMGDGGAYLFGAITSLNVINISIMYPDISPLFFTTLLFYLFFEVFFSFIRKVKIKNSPLKPDKLHLHMIIFRYLKDFKNDKNPNPKTSIYINSFFILTIIPSTIFRYDGVFCRFWFLFQILLYVFIYYKFYNFTKKTI